VVEQKGKAGGGPVEAKQTRSPMCSCKPWTQNFRTSFIDKITGEDSPPGGGLTSAKRYCHELATPVGESQKNRKREKAGPGFFEDRRGFSLARTKRRKIL